MPATSARARARLDTIARELDVVRIGRDPLHDLVPEIRSLLEVESIVVYSVREATAGWQFDRWHLDQLPSERIRNGMLRLFSRGHGPVLFYDMACPAPAQRNRLIEATSMIDANHPGAWQASALFREVLHPLGLGHHQQHRILLCDRSSLLAWFGAFHPGGLNARQQRLLRAVARLLHRRLRMERLLEVAPHAFALLEAALAHVGAPAFVLGPRGRIVATNTDGRRLLDTGGRNVRTALAAAVAGHRGAIAFDVTEVRDLGIPVHWLAVGRPSLDAQVAAAMGRAGRRWHITRRQAQVLDLVIRGLANTTIAAELGTSTRSVEMHVTALLDKAGVDSRAALVANVLTR